MINDWNESGVLFAALPAILARGTAPPPYYQGAFPIYYNDTIVSGNFIDMTSGYGYSGNYIKGDNSGYLHTDYPHTFSDTSILTIESTINYNSRASAQYICGSYAASTDYWYSYVTTSGEIMFSWTVGSSGGYVMTESGSLTDGTSNTIYLEKNLSGVSIYVGSGECNYQDQSPYDQGTGNFSSLTVLNYNEMGTVGMMDEMCKFVTYSRVLTDDEKNWNDNNCSYSGLIGYDSGVFLSVVGQPTVISIMPGLSFTIKKNFRSSLVNQYFKGGLRGTIS